MLCGCLPEGAPPWEVDHTIVAAIRFDVAARGPYSPPPSRPDRAVAEVLPGDAIRMTPFLIGPQGPLDLAAAAPAWFYCPTTRCFGEVTRGAPVRDCEAEPVPVATTCRIRGGPRPVLQLGALTSMQVFGDPPAVMMVSGTPEGPSTTLCLERLAKLTQEAETLQACVMIVEPLPIGALWRLLAAAASLGLADASTLAAITTEVQQAQPSMYPEVQPFALTITGPTGEARQQTASSEATVRVRPGEVVTIEAPVNPLDAQLYYQASVSAGELVMLAQFESFGSSWLFSQALAEPTQDAQEITWVVPEEAVAPIYGYYLLSDGRSTVWGWLRFEVARSAGS